MPKFGKIENGIIVETIVAENIQWCITNPGGRWVEVDDNNIPKEDFPGPKPYASWILNDKTYFWQAPVPYPTDDKSYRWDEDTVSWVEILI